MLSFVIPRLSSELSTNLQKEFKFDVVASPGERLSSLSTPFQKEDDALKKNWFDNSEKKSILFIPPADERMGRWLAKAVYESRKGATVIGILPLRADREWFHKYIQNVAAEVRFIKASNGSWPDITFLGAPLAVVVFKEFKGTTRFTTAGFNGEVTEHLN